MLSGAQKAALSPETVLAQMKQNGVTHVVWLPDSETNWLFLLMQADPSLTLVGVNREGLAFSAASGLYTGGKTPLILIQNTGLMESGDSMRGWTIQMEVPVVLMVGYRGWAIRPWAGMPRSRWDSRSRSRARRSCCSTPTATSR